MSGDALDRLAALAGIEEGWWDFFGTYRQVSADTKRAFLAAMGFAVGSDGETADSLAAFEAAGWSRWLEPVSVAVAGPAAPEVTLTVPDLHAGEPLAWTLDEEDGTAHGGQVVASTLPAPAEYQGPACGPAGGAEGPRRRYRFRLPVAPPLGVHRLRVVSPDGIDAQATLIVAPPVAYRPAALAEGRKLWGYATQLYALRHAQDWGLGDFTALALAGRQAAAQGASTIGINPLHALFANRPDRYSPYAPSSRVFLNTVYLDVEAIPDFTESVAARRLYASPGFQARLSAARSAQLVDYREVGALKLTVLKLCWEHFAARHLDGGGTARGAAFREFQRVSGHKTERFATFNALQEFFLAADPDKGYWRHWPAEYLDPEGPAVVAFALANRSRVEFFWYLEWLAEEQLAAAHAACRDAGMPIGVYRDLGVGIAEDGAEAWANQGLLCLGVSVGAPPDPLNLSGQDWGLVPFNPVALREAAYKPFLTVLEANMAHAGAMRLDHAMSLQRLYWVPRGARADQGAYVRYPRDDLFALVALASQRQRCLVIGEDLGTVPEGFRERLDATGMLGYRLMVFEQNDQGLKPPEQIASNALIAFGTHDLPCLGGWWKALDAEARQRLGLYPDPAMAERESEGRARDRQRLVAALAAHGLLDPGFPTGPELSDEQLRQLALAVYAYLDRAPSQLLMVQFEDVLGLCMQMNLPGTVEEFPDWRYRYPASLPDMLDDPRLAAVAAVLAGRRPR